MSPWTPAARYHDLINLSINVIRAISPKTSRFLTRNAAVEVASANDIRKEGTTFNKSRDVSVYLANFIQN